MPKILFVRVKSSLARDELTRRAQERVPRFREVPGLVQKFYGRDPSTGTWCGAYIFESQEALAAFAGSELAKSIPAAYEATEVTREVYDFLWSLHPERGPLANPAS